jgi:hypothetical protein
MNGRVLSWTKVERPPAGFAPGRVLALVEGADGVRRYALWEGRGDPPMGGAVRLEPHGALWGAR